MGTLRFILAVSVLIAHTDSILGLNFVPGLVAVQIFFVISGFYMALILNRKYVGEGSYKLFITNRALRLLPVYWVVLIATLIVSFVLYFIFDEWSRLSAYMTYYDVLAPSTWLFNVFTNLTLLGQDLTIFMGLNEEAGTIYLTNNYVMTAPHFYTFLFVPQAWTLGIEIMFYIIAPFIVRRSNGVILFILALSVAARIGIYALGYDYDPWTYRFFPFELALFLAGSLSFRLYEAIKSKSFFNARNQKIIGFIAALLLLFYYQIPGNEGGISTIFNFILYLFFALAIPFIFGLTKDIKWDARIGELSYPIYIVHWLIIDILTPITSRYEIYGFQGEITLILTLVTSYALVRFVADPIEKVRHERVKKANA